MLYFLQLEPKQTQGIQNECTHINTVARENALVQFLQLHFVRGRVLKLPQATSARTLLCYTLDDRQDNNTRQLGRLTVKQVVKLGCSLFFDSIPDSESTVRRRCRMDLLYRFIINKLALFYFKR